MHQTPAVRVVERGSHLATDMRCLRGAQARSRVEHVPQGPTDEQLQDHERHAVLAPVVHRHHVRVVQGSGELRLGPEAAQEPGVVGQPCVEHFDRDPTPQADVVGDVHPTARA